MMTWARTSPGLVCLVLQHYDEEREDSPGLSDAFATMVFIIGQLRSIARLQAAATICHRISSLLPNPNLLTSVVHLRALSVSGDRVLHAVSAAQLWMVRAATALFMGGRAAYLTTCSHLCSSWVNFRTDWDDQGLLQQTLS